MLNKMAMKEVQRQCFELAVKKNKDYAGTLDNIGACGIQGVATRLVDKVSRVHNLASGKRIEVKDEAVRDTLIDTANYAIFGIMLLDRQWETSPKN